jgi:hypothetical protein
MEVAQMKSTIKNIVVIIVLMHSMFCFASCARTCYQIEVKMPNGDNPPPQASVQLHRVGYTVLPRVFSTAYFNDEGVATLSVRQNDAFHPMLHGITEMPIPLSKAWPTSRRPSNREPKWVNVGTSSYDLAMARCSVKPCK